MERKPKELDRRAFVKMALWGTAAFSVAPLASGAWAAVSETAGTAAVNIGQIRLAADRLKGNIQRTPLVDGGLLDKRTGARVFLKLETMQYTGAFKERGALNKMCMLTREERARGVIAASAGNHSQGVAYHATRMGIRSVIAMPVITPRSKVQRTRSLGAEVIVTGDCFDESLNYALNKAKTDGLTFIHPFDDPMVIDGQGTVGLEIMEDMPETDVLLVPVGGGGLIAGCATAARALHPKIRIYGIESKNYAAMRQRLHHLPVKTGGETLAEGLAVHNVGDLPFSIVRDLVDDVLAVEEESIAEAVVLLFKQKKIVAEGAGAVGVAALLEHGGRFAGKRVVTPVTGGNIDSRVFATLLHRSMVKNGCLVRLLVTSPGRGEAYPEIASLLAGSGATVVNVQFDPVFSASSAKSPAYYLILETRDENHAREVAELLGKRGFTAELQH